MTGLRAVRPAPGLPDTLGRNERLPPDWIDTPSMVAEGVAVGLLCVRLMTGPDAGCVALWEQAHGWRLWVPAVGRWIDTSGRTVTRMAAGSKMYAYGLTVESFERVTDPNAGSRRRRSS